jgi:hypothetical protein
MTNAPSLTTTIEALERRLHDPSVRASQDAIAALLADDFIEIGASGKTFDKTQVIAALLNEAPREIAMSNFSVRSLADDLALATYRAQINANASLRSSLWRFESGQWRMAFHQGTPIA